MRVVWNDKVIAEAPKAELIFIEGNWYFPPSSIASECFRKSSTPYYCPWKGDCQYYDIGDGNRWSRDSAFTYPTPKQSAINRVKKDFSGYFAFWRDAKVID